MYTSHLEIQCTYSTVHVYLNNFLRLFSSFVPHLGVFRASSPPGVFRPGVFRPTSLRVSSLRVSSLRPSSLVSASIFSCLYVSRLRVYRLSSIVFRLPVRPSNACYYRQMMLLPCLPLTKLFCHIIHIVLKFTFYAL